ncbi:MAG: transglutaminase family protein [Phycisphaeraceae bacterium]
MRIKQTILVLLVLVLALPLSARAEEAKTFEPYEAWYVLKLGGQRAGHMHTSLRLDEGKIINETEMVIVIKRGETELRIEQASRFVETREYEPLQAQSKMKLALMATEQAIDFTGDKWAITATNAGQKTQTEVDPLKTDWLTPGGLNAHFNNAMSKGETEITVTTLDPSMGVTPVTVNMKRGETKDIEVFGKVIPATLWKTTMSNAPGIEVEQWTNEAGQPVKQNIPLMPGMEIEMLLADKALALAEFDAPEMLAASFITPDKKIKNPRTLKRAVYDLVGKDLKKNIGEALDTGGYQSAKWIDEETLRITVDIKERGFDKRAAQGDLPGKEYLASTTVLNHKDPKVAALADEAFKTAPPPARAPTIRGAISDANHVRQFVRDYIDAKDLSVGFATASEVARTKQGDCTEHACLLAAVLRGGQMPSRTVTGLVYADQFAGHQGIFGFHMWTQVWIANPRGGGFWYDLDAAMPGDIAGFDATHIALSTSAMSDGENFNDMVKLLPLMQGMKINVVELGWGKKNNREVPADF